MLKDNPAPPEIVAQATAIKEHVLVAFSAGEAIVAASILAKCHYQLATTSVDTMAVMLMADGTTALLYNPYFTVALGESGARFVMFHESRHILYRHLFAEAHLRSEPLFKFANEIGINHDTLQRFKQDKMPTVAVLAPDGTPVLNADGTELRQPTGVDPRVEWEKYKKDLEKQELVPVPYEDFVRTDYACFQELKRTSNPPSSGGESGSEVCVHGDDGEGDVGTGPMDDATAEDAAKQALRQLMKAAVGGNEVAREQLLELAERTEDASEGTSKLWGDLGLSRLRGQTLANRRVDWWQQWVSDHLASRLEPGERLIYNKKRGALDMLLGNDPVLSHRGDDEMRLAVVAIDTSGSMPDHVLDYLTKLVGHTDGVEFIWTAFDGAIERFEPGKAVHGGGGTNFGLVQEYVEGRREVAGHRLEQHPDVVLMLTDGYASPIQPAEPDKWVWLITEDGDQDWIKEQGDMVSHQLLTGDGV